MSYALHCIHEVSAVRRCRQAMAYIPLAYMPLVVYTI